MDNVLANSGLEPTRAYLASCCLLLQLERSSSPSRNGWPLRLKPHPLAGRATIPERRSKAQDDGLTEPASTRRLLGWDTLE